MKPLFIATGQPALAGRIAAKSTSWNLSAKTRTRYMPVGGKMCKQRPAAIVSNDAANQFLNRVQVMPLTGSTGKLYPSEAYVTFRGRQSKAMADQLTTVSKNRLINKGGLLSSADMERVARAISTQLDL